MIKNNMEAVIQDNRVIYKRYFDAPISLVFEAWSSHEHLAQWWGPDGFTLTTNSMNFTKDGIWDFIMHGPDGHDYNNKIQFTDIVKPRHIYYKHLGESEDTKDVVFQSKIIFTEAGGGTNLTMEQIFSSREELERINKKYGAIEGGKQHLGNLARYLDTLK